MYLVDTNVWLELLLERQHANDVREFFRTVEARQLAISDFTIYSMGIILTRLGKPQTFDDFLSDTLEDSGVAVMRLEPGELREVLAVQKQHRLDFDDGYQYVTAEKHSFTLVSFDGDFDRTKRGRKTPTDVLQALKTAGSS
ncbi:MAG: type II toxin-antitoxin system VapC family toxin [Verrucomicrobia bacterium]|nr:type II toxin-antitoxin system VapC family toxin [Verrucomicrobiota bacterium]